MLHRVSCNNILSFLQRNIILGAKQIVSVTPTYIEPIKTSEVKSQSIKHMFNALVGASGHSVSAGIKEQVVLLNTKNNKADFMIDVAYSSTGKQYAPNRMLRIADYYKEPIRMSLVGLKNLPSTFVSFGRDSSGNDLLILGHFESRGGLSGDFLTRNDANFYTINNYPDDFRELLSNFQTYTLTVNGEKVNIDTHTSNEQRLTQNTNTRTNNFFTSRGGIDNTLKVQLDTILNVDKLFQGTRTKNTLLSQLAIYFYDGHNTKAVIIDNDSSNADLISAASSFNPDAIRQVNQELIDSGKGNEVGNVLNTLDLSGTNISYPDDTESALSYISDYSLDIPITISKDGHGFAIIDRDNDSKYLIRFNDLSRIKVSNLLNPDLFFNHSNAEKIATNLCLNSLKNKVIYNSLLDGNVNLLLQDKSFSSFIRKSDRFRHLIDELKKRVGKQTIGKAMVDNVFNVLARDVLSHIHTDISKLKSSGDISELTHNVPNKDEIVYKVSSDSQSTLFDYIHDSAKIHEVISKALGRLVTYRGVAHIDNSILEDAGYLVEDIENNNPSALTLSGVRVGSSSNLPTINVNKTPISESNWDTLKGLLLHPKMLRRYGNPTKIILAFFVARDLPHYKNLTPNDLRDMDISSQKNTLAIIQRVSNQYRLSDKDINDLMVIPEYYLTSDSGINDYTNKIIKRHINDSIDLKLLGVTPAELSQAVENHETGRFYDDLTDPTKKDDVHGEMLDDAEQITNFYDGRFTNTALTRVINANTLKKQLLDDYQTFLKLIGANGIRKVMYIPNTSYNHSNPIRPVGLAVFNGRSGYKTVKTNKTYHPKGLTIFHGNYAINAVIKNNNVYIAALYNINDYNKYFQDCRNNGDITFEIDGADFRSNRIDGLVKTITGVGDSVSINTIRNYNPNTNSPAPPSKAGSPADDITNGDSSFFTFLLWLGFILGAFTTLMVGKDTVNKFISSEVKRGVTSKRRVAYDFKAQYMKNNRNTMII